MHFFGSFLTIDEEENKEPKSLELGNEVEGAGQSKKRSKILTEPEHQQATREEFQPPQHPTDTTKEKMAGN